MIDDEHDERKDATAVTGRAINRRVWLVAVGIVALIGLGVTNVLYIDHVDRESARGICGLIVVLDEAYSRTPPTTDLGRTIAQEMHAYRRRLGC